MEASRAAHRARGGLRLPRGRGAVRGHGARTLRAGARLPGSGRALRRLAAQPYAPGLAPRPLPGAPANTDKPRERAYKRDRYGSRQRPAGVAWTPEGCRAQQFEWTP